MMTTRIPTCLGLTCSPVLTAAHDPWVCNTSRLGCKYNTYLFILCYVYLDAEFNLKYSGFLTSWIMCKRSRFLCKRSSHKRLLTWLLVSMVISPTHCDIIWLPRQCHWPLWHHNGCLLWCHSLIVTWHISWVGQ